MKVQSIAPAQSAESAPVAKPARFDDATRCQHRTPSGRRCKLPVHRTGEHLCYDHKVEYKNADAFNLQVALLDNSHAFQTAQGINNALQNLYGLLANNFISPRRASVLAYISSLLLRTLPAIDADRAAGITGPIAPANTPASEQKPEDPPAAAAGRAAAAATDAVHSEHGNGAAATSPDTHPSGNREAQGSSPWPEGVPEPDLTKKPS